MKKLISIILGVVLFIPFSGQAAWTGEARIDSLKVHSWGVNIRLKGFENINTEVVCPDTRTFVLVSDDTEIYDTKVSFLLSAYMSKTSVNFSYYECIEGKIQLSSIMIRD
ncbi:hypothetical protein ACCI51_17710 [Microbulbifer echini]|uniref:Uncharacterized protein n=1 Tax=Microbulbifer echini TaxID=1529067 RepID=A0ABV4NTC2_9GAMM